ncbi:MAG TPA: tetratricopeptide repeat protein [Verrucomicrobiae bacterium]|nr:tetratricopeptide repeat protein [Verrucomicrobiae bacterium]
MCLIVIVIYMGAVQSGVWEALSTNGAESYYNLLAQGFHTGQLSLKKDVPVGFRKLADPYDPVANARYRAYPYRLHDLSYYKGQLYLYFGITPAVMLFWPFVAATGRCVFERQAAVIFDGIGFLISVGLVHAMWRRYFAEVSSGVVAGCVLALGLATGAPVMLTRCEVYEVAISCGYMFTMLALAAIWCALHKPEQRCRWLAAASLAYGLAVGARPSLLFGGVVLLVPAAQAWRERRNVRGALWAALGPIGVIGVGLMAYNTLRFDNPFEFGWHYQLAIRQQVTGDYFRLRYLWFNSWIYLLAPVHWSAQFPFVDSLTTLPPVNGGHRWVERTFGVLINTPVVGLALAAPLAWRGRPGRETSSLRWFVMGAGVLLATCAVSVSLLPDAYLRYEAEFLPALVFVAVVGILGLERVASSHSLRRKMIRSSWCLVLAYSVAFNLLASVEQCAVAHNSFGIGLVQLGRLDDAIGQYERALQIKPDFAEAQNNLGNVLAQLGSLREAVAHYEQAIRLKTDYAEGHNDLAVALMGLGRFEEAIAHGEEAVRIEPDYVEAQFNLGLALEKAGRTTEAIGHYRTALKLEPDLIAANKALVRLKDGQ